MRRRLRASARQLHLGIHFVSIPASTGLGRSSGDARRRSRPATRAALPRALPRDGPGRASLGPRSGSLRWHSRAPASRVRSPEARRSSVGRDARRCLLNAPRGFVARFEADQLAFRGSSGRFAGSRPGFAPKRYRPAIHGRKSLCLSSLVCSIHFQFVFCIPSPRLAHRLKRLRILMACATRKPFRDGKKRVSFIPRARRRRRLRRRGVTPPRPRARGTPPPSSSSPPQPKRASTARPRGP